MFVIESLDADTELRRLSPVALSSNGYTDLLNGPMDHGCCFGYACMERISTFFSIVATQNNYTVYFTGKQIYNRGISTRLSSRKVYFHFNKKTDQKRKTLKRKYGFSLLCLVKICTLLQCCAKTNVRAWPCGKL